MLARKTVSSALLNPFIEALKEKSTLLPGKDLWSSRLRSLAKKIEMTLSDLLFKVVEIVKFDLSFLLIGQINPWQH